MTVKLSWESMELCALASSMMPYPTELTNRGQKAIVTISETLYDSRSL